MSNRHVRGRSISEYLPKALRDGKSRDFDPGTFLNPLPDWVLDNLDTLCIRIWDKDKIIELRLNTFLSKSYPCTDGRVQIGIQSLVLEDMSMMIGIVVDCHDFESMSDMNVD